MKSLKGKLVLMLLTIVFSVLMVLFIANNVLLEPYYTEREKAGFTTTYERIRAVAEEKPSELVNYLSQISANSTTTIVVTDNNYNLLYSSTNIRRSALAYFAQLLPIPPGEEYAIKTIQDQTGSQHLVMFAELNPYCKLFLTKPIASITKSTEIYNEFFLIAIIVIGLIGAIIMFLIGSFFVKPIYEMVDISKRITNLDFSKKFRVRGDDEINILGEQINIMSDRLSQNILMLSRANAALQNDLSQKERVEKMRKEFLQNASHELKTPISVIASYTEMLKDKMITEEEDKEYYYNVIYEETEKMGSIVKNLLGMAQLESQSLQVNPEGFDISDLLTDVLTSFQLHLEKKEINLTKSIEQNVVVHADKFLIERVMTNYISNAIDHIDEKKQMQISLYKEDGMVYFGVYNSTDQILDSEKIWTSFYKSDVSSGNGLGLSIVKAIMDAHKKPCGFRHKDDGVEFFIQL
ncbi:MAG: HAMP domain-containing histidine kinase [Clostridia bacterium]|nr:HAMP domain-containing histidine kinase [Clostridia bacterium]